MRRIIHAVVLVLVVSLAARAQVATGRISGTIVDTTGGRVGDASIELSGPYGPSHLRNDGGIYHALALRPGDYRLTVVREGFKTAVRTDIHVVAGDDKVVDVILEPGEVREQVVVRARSIPNNGAVAGTLDERTILMLPLNGRELFQLLALMPGVVPAAERSQNATQGGAVSVNGAREQSNNFLLDGVDNNDLLINQIVVQPSLDALQEITIVKSTYAAEFGRSAGGQFSLKTRSGTERWRTTTYGFFRNSALDARNYFDDPRRPTPAFNQRQFGATAGGRIGARTIGVFSSYEGLRARKQFTRVAHVPPAAWLAGDFSGLLTGIVNPATGLDVGQLVDPRTFAPIPGNRIPAALLNPAGVALARLYPAPDDPSAITPTAATVQPLGRSRSDQFTIRLDTLRSSGNNLFARYTYSRMRRTNPFDPFVDPTNVPGFGSVTSDNNGLFAAGYTHRLSSTMTSELRVGWNRFHGGIFQEETDDIASQLGIGGLTRATGHAGRPGVIVGITDPLIDPYNTPQDRRDTTFHLSQRVNWQAGNHAFAAGGELRRFTLDYYLDLYARGQLTFVGLSGNPIADLLMGIPTIALRMNPSLDTMQNVRTTAINLYLQDDWRVTPALTLNVGVRYEFAQPPFEQQNRFSVPDLSSPVTRFDPVGTNGIPRSGFEADRNNVAPRLGVSWRPPTTETVVRGGYGIFYDTGILNLNIFPRYNPPNFALDLFAGPRPIETAFTGGDAIPLTAANGIDRRYRDGYYHQFSASVQREVSQIGQVDVAYTGSRGRNLQLMRDLNQGPPGGPAFRNPAFGPARIASSSGWSTYDALQITLDRPSQRGPTWRASYTRSRSIDNGSSLFGSAGSPDFPQDSFNLDGERGPSSFDTPHRLVVTSSWDIPAPAGNRAASLLRGWTAAGIVTYQSGRPFTVHYGPSANYSGTDNGANGGAGFDRPHLVGSPDVRRDPRRWFDPAAFAPAIGAFGNAGRNMLRGDAVKNVDVALYKTISTRPASAADVQLRAEIFNLLNRPFFHLPVADLTRGNAGQVTRASDGRQLQLSARLSF